MFVLHFVISFKKQMQLMVAATLILLCTKPFEAVMLGRAPWLLTVPAITIIGREVRAFVLSSYRNN